MTTASAGFQRKLEIAYADFERLDIRVGVVTDVEDFPRAKKPAYRITVDFGENIGMKQSSVQAKNYNPDSLKGMQVIAVINLPPKNIAGFQSEVLILGVPGENGELSLLTPSFTARKGGAVY
jgi:tRNA-binding protein